MADKPHYSTLLDKPEMTEEEISDDDFSYVLKSGGDVNRDRRLSFGNLKNWVLGKMPDWFLNWIDQNAVDESSMQDGWDLNSQIWGDVRNMPSGWSRGKITLGKLFSMIFGNVPNKLIAPRTIIPNMHGTWTEIPTLIPGSKGMYNSELGESVMSTLPSQAPWHYNENENYEDDKFYREYTAPFHILYIPKFEIDDVNTDYPNGGIVRFVLPYYFKGLMYIPQNAGGAYDAGDSNYQQRTFHLQQEGFRSPKATLATFKANEQWGWFDCDKCEWINSETKIQSIVENRFQNVESAIQNVENRLQNVENIPIVAVNSYQGYIDVGAEVLANVAYEDVHDVIHIGMTFSQIAGTTTQTNGLFRFGIRHYQWSIDGNGPSLTVNVGGTFMIMSIISGFGTTNNVKIAQVKRIA